MSAEARTYDLVDELSIVFAEFILSGGCKTMKLKKKGKTLGRSPSGLVKKEFNNFVERITDRFGLLGHQFECWLEGK